MPASSKHPSLVAIACLAWVVAVALGARVLISYGSSAGPDGVPSSDFPLPGSIIPVSQRPTLIMLAHPQCPCTRASIGELAKLMAHVQGKVSAFVLFLKPEDSDESWVNTDLWQSASAIPGVTLLRDHNGAEAGRLGIETSGHTLLYDSSGRRRFSGGITAARGHAGDNAGRMALASLLMNDDAAASSKTPVFGCSLFGARP